MHKRLARKMPHATLPQQAVVKRKSSEKRIEERFQAGLQLQALYALPIYQLPAEIMLNVLNQLELKDYPALIAAAWHLLRHHGIAPSIPTPKLQWILVEPRRGFYTSFEHATDYSREKSLPAVVRKQMFSRLAPGPSFFMTFTDVGVRLRGGLERLPPELKDLIFSKLDPATKVNVALAGYRFSDRDIEWLTHKEV